MNCITPDKRKDGRSSFEKLIAYVCVREGAHSTDAVPNPDDAPARVSRRAAIDAAFDALITEDSVEQTADVTQILSDGRQRVVCGEVLCETNCFSLDTAALEMETVASESRRCKDPVYHFILSWREEDKPQNDDIFTCVQDALKKLNMEGHQYVAAIHRDTDNVHVHVGVNRVNPETFKSVSLWNNYDHLQQCCREMERRFGYAVDNGSWHLTEHDELVRTSREARSAPRGARAREIFSDRESLHGYAVRETRQKISDIAEQDHLSWGLLHNVLYTRGLGLREQNGGLAIYDLLNPDGISVKASDVHPAISLPSMVSRCGEYQSAPPTYNPDKLEDGVLATDSFYMPQLHVRDQDVRRERREARAIDRDILRARYDAYRTGWKKPDLRAAERFRQIVSHSVVMKSHVRETVRDPLMRKLMYRVAEFEKMKGMAELRLQLRDERTVLSDAGANRPLSWKSWVEREALQGDVAAISQMRGWAYREKRREHQQNKAWPEPNAIIHFGPGEDVTTFRSNEHETRLLRDGTVSYLRKGSPAVTDFGDRVEVYAAADSQSDRFNNDLAAELTAWRSGDNTVVTGEQTAVNRVLYSGVVRNLNKNDGRSFSVSDPLQMANVRATEEHLRDREVQTELRQTEPQYREDDNMRPLNKDLPRP
jgi:hypothetical protein